MQKEKFAIEDGYKWCKKACSRGSRGSKKKVGLCVSVEDLGGEKLRWGVRKLLPGSLSKPSHSCGNEEDVPETWTQRRYKNCP